MASFLEKSILGTVAYYDVLGLSLTGFELWKYLVRQQTTDNRQQDEIRLCDVVRALGQSKLLRKTLEHHQGFWFFKGRKHLVAQRINFMKEVDQKLKKAKRILARLQFLPYIRAIFISGSVGVGHPRKESDIDILVVTKSGRIWTGRALVTLFLVLLGKRRFRQDTKDKICLNHFITDKSLTIPYPSLYNAQTYAHLIPAFLKTQNLYERFYQENQWIGEYLVNSPFGRSPDLLAIKINQVLDGIGRALKRILDGPLGGYLECRLKGWQKRRIAKDPRSWQQGGRVVAKDEHLEFHPASKESHVLKAYNKKIKALGLPELIQEKDSGLL